MIEHIYFSGRVQGVGFRFTTQRIASQIGLTGWVRNLGDGRVEAFLCGSSQQIEQSIRELQSYFGDKIRDIDRRSVDSMETYNDFQVRH